MSLLARPVDAQWPVNEDNPFGQPATAYTDLGYLGHPGIDFKCPKGTPVYAADDGEVVWTGLAGSAGLMVTITHTHGGTRYLHLSDTNVSSGMTVTRGEIIGWSGGRPGDYGAGLTFGEHVHWDYYPNGESTLNGYGGRRNPLDYMEGGTVRTPAQQRIIDVYRANSNSRLKELERASALFGKGELARELLIARDEINSMTDELEVEWPQ